MKVKMVCASILAVLSITAGPTAWAETPPSPGVAVTAPGPGFDPTERAQHRVEIRSSVQVSRDVLREAYMASRDAYTKKLQRYASCSPAQAEKAVHEAHPGMKITNLQLRNVRTNLVYFAVAEDDEDRYVVIVDAGNGKILADRPYPTHHERAFAY